MRAAAARRTDNRTMSDGKRAIIIGAGPAGLTAAHELLTRSDVKPVVLEMSKAMGGLAQTVDRNNSIRDDMASVFTRAISNAAS